MQKSKRPSWDSYFMDQCELISTRSTCDRKHVGAILVKDRRILASGYNGSLPGEPHCDDPPYFLECMECGDKLEVSESEFKELEKSENSISCNRWNTSFESHQGSLRCMGKPMSLQEGGHIIQNGHCIRTIHAEVNAITQASRQGISTEGSILYCNTLPCLQCFTIAVSAGVKKIIYRDDYNSQVGDRYSTLTLTSRKSTIILQKFKPK